MNKQYNHTVRHYDPADIRFTTMDPMMEKYYSISPYVYAANNPMKFIDPTGKYWRDVVVGYAIGFATNITPLSSSVRDSYSPTSSSDYNRALQGVDNASMILGGLMISGGAATAGAVVAATGIGAPEGAAIAIVRWSFNYFRRGIYCRSCIPYGKYS